MGNPTEGPSAAPGPTSPTRLASLDALRGFDMFWLLGGQRIATEFAARFDGPIAVAVRTQFEHAEWEGFRFYDLIFPLFLFVIGAAVPFSIASRQARGATRPAIIRHALVRAGILIFLGTWINGNLLTYDPAKFQLTYSVLQMLALGYVVAVLLCLYLTVKGQAVATASLLVGYWLVQAYVPVPGHQPGVLKPGANFGDWLNDRLLGDWQGPWRFGWVFEITTHGATAMFGVLAGHLLRSRQGPHKKAAVLAAVGVSLLALGLLWGQVFPIVKDRWTSSFAVYAAGWSYLMLAVSFLLVDLWGLKRAAFPFVVIGANSIVAYLIACLFMPSFRHAAGVFLRGLEPRIGPWYGPVLAVGTAFAAWLFLYAMYRAKLFVKV